MENKELKERFIDENLKAENQLEWVSKMNNIKNRAEGAPRKISNVA